MVTEIPFPVAPSFQASCTFMSSRWPRFKYHICGHLKLSKTYRKSSIRSRPLIQVYSIRGRAIGVSVQALIIGKSLNPSKLPYLDLYELLQIKNFALEIVIFEIPLIQV